MKTLEDLKALCAAATPGPWRRSKSFVIQTKHVTRDIWTIADCQHNEDADPVYIATFNPELVSALLDEVMAGREKNEWAHNWRDSEIYDKARERLDAILRGE